MPGKKYRRVCFRGRTLPVLARLLSELSARDIFAGQPRAAADGCLPWRGSRRFPSARLAGRGAVLPALLSADSENIRSLSALNHLVVKAEPSVGLCELLQEALQSIACARPGFNTFSVASWWFFDPVTCCQCRNCFFSLLCLSTCHQVGFALQQTAAEVELDIITVTTDCF